MKGEWKQVELLATDTGYSYLKGAWKEGNNLRLVRIPSAVAQFEDNASGLEGALIPDIYYKGSYYLAGEKAKKFESRLIDTYQEDFSVVYTPVLMYELMRENKILPQKVCVSIALSEFDKEIIVFDPEEGIKRGKKKKLIRNYSSSFVINGEKFEFEVFVFPQGVGIWLDVGTPENAVIVDIGDRTVDIVFVREGQIIGAGYTMGFQNEGTMKIADALSREIRKLTGKAVDIKKAKMWLEEDSIIYGGREIDLKHIKQRIGLHYIRELITKLNAKPEIKDFIDTYGRVIFAGGGARFVPEEIKEYFNIEVPSEPEFSNVRGFLKALEEENDDKVKV
jgi:hypothetical protein